MSKIKVNVTDHFAHLVNLNKEFFDDEMHPWRQKVKKFIKVFYVGFRELLRDHCFERAAGLSFATIISLIPLAVLFLSMVTLMGWNVQIISFIENAIFPYIAPDFQNELKLIIEEYISPTVFTSKSTGILNIAAIVALILLALEIWVMAEIVFNSIWRVRESRTYLQKIFSFWVILTISPFLFLLSIYLGEVLGPESILFKLFGEYQPVLVIIYNMFVPSVLAFASFAVMHALLPATRVRFNSAAIGALVSLILWEILRRSFSIYLMNITHYTNFYKQLAAVPLFLIWIYAIWLIILFGAEIAFVHQNYYYLNKHYSSRFKRPTYSIGYIGLFILSKLYQAFEKGVKLPSMFSLAEELGIAVEKIEETTRTLEEFSILASIEGHKGQYTFSMSPEKIQLKEVMGKLLEKELVGELVLEDGKLRVDSQHGFESQLNRSYNSFLAKFEGRDLTQIVGKGRK